MILQLGIDSIKDHSAALVELVKNSFDADALKLEVEIYCAFACVLKKLPSQLNHMRQLLCVRADGFVAKQTPTTS